MHDPILYEDSQMKLTSDLTGFSGIRYLRASIECHSGAVTSFNISSDSHDMLGKL